MDFIDPELLDAGTHAELDDVERENEHTHALALVAHAHAMGMDESPASLLDSQGGGGGGGYGTGTGTGGDVVDGKMMSASPANGASGPGTGNGGAELGTPDAAGGGSAKRAKKEAEDAKKRTRQSQSCDACRARKVKCDRPAPPIGTPPSAEEKCTHCRQLHMDCTFDYVPKKRGPPNQYLKRLKSEREAAEAAQNSSSDDGGAAGASDAGPGGKAKKAIAGDGIVAMRTPPAGLRFDFTVPPTPPLNGAGAGATRSSPLGPGSVYVHPGVESYHAPDTLSGAGTLSRQNAYGQSALAEQGSAVGLGPVMSPMNVYDPARGRHIDAMWDETLSRAVAASSASASAGPGSSAVYSPSEIDRANSYAAASLGFAPAPAHPQALPARKDYSADARLTPMSGSLPPPSMPSLSPSAAFVPLGTSAGAPNMHARDAYALNRRASSFSHSHQERPARPGNPLDAILPRWLLYHIVDLYFDYIYPLIPVIHRPTFMRDLDCHREEQAGEDEWTHMTIALVASTLVQLPRSFVPLRRREVKQLVETSYRIARMFTLSDGRELTVQRLTMNYFLSAATGLTGHPTSASYLMGGQAALFIRMRWNQENMYTHLPPLERELRRRLYWLAYNGDRSWASIEGNTTVFTEDECSGVNLPLEVDDDFISDEGVRIEDQPEGHVPILTGFNYISKLYRLCGIVMDRRRRDKRELPSGVPLQIRLNEVNDLYDQVVGLMDDCPEPLRLGVGEDARSFGGFSDDWDAQASADVRSLFLDPKVNKSVVRDTYLVQQANIYVTQQMVRYMVLNYRDELLALQQAELARTSSAGGRAGSIAGVGVGVGAAGSAAAVAGGGAAGVGARAGAGPGAEGKSGGTSAGAGAASRRKSMSRREWSQFLINEEEKEQVAMDLLNVLQRIPIQVIAVNTSSLVSKVRFVASTLLDALAAPSAQEQAQMTPEQARAAAKTQRAQTYLWDFLRILSEIEALYSMEDDENE